MNQMPGLCLPASQPGFTPKQGQYLAFIHAYTLVIGRLPAEADLQRFFRVTLVERVRRVRQSPADASRTALRAALGVRVDIDRSLPTARIG